MKEIESLSKGNALELVKAHYEDFYNRYAATAPEKVNKIHNFLDWLKTATENDLTVEEKPFWVRKCSIKTQVKYFFHVDGSNFSHIFDIDILFANDEVFASHFTDVYYSNEASSKIVPGDITEIAEEEARKALKRANVDAIYYSSFCNYDITDPQEDKYLSCVLKYPHKTKDNVSEKELNYIVWNGEAYIKNDETLGESPIPSSSGGCYVATAVYGSYDCPQVWTLRRYRDYTLAASWCGRAFIRIYYAISPTLVKWFGKTKWFKNICKQKLDKMVMKLNANGVDNTPYNDINWNKKNIGHKKCAAKKRTFYDNE